MRDWQAKRTRAKTCQSMNNTKKLHTSEVRAEQVTKVSGCEAIYLGADLHKQSITITRIMDRSTPQPAQRFTWEGFWKFVQKQLALAAKVYVVYEAGAFGFWPARRLKEMGAECYVVHPEKLDPRHKRVQNDKLDSRHLADKLQRYVLGNKHALVRVYIPSEAEENRRIESRHRRHLAEKMRSLQARGRGLLLSVGIFEAGRWWKEEFWQELKPKLPAELQAALEDDRALILLLSERLRASEKKLQAAAPKQLPCGFGKLTFVLLLRELCTYSRFENRRNIAGFSGLCGAVSSSGPYHVDLSINKAGNAYIRTLLVELAWRMIYWQPQARCVAPWRRLFAKGAGEARVHKRRRKIAVVAVARQMAVDIWRWQTGRATPEQLGWKIATAA